MLLNVKRKSTEQSAIRDDTFTAARKIVTRPRLRTIIKLVFMAPSQSFFLSLRPFELFSISKLSELNLFCCTYVVFSAHQIPHFGDNVLAGRARSYPSPDHYVDVLKRITVSRRREIMTQNYEITIREITNIRSLNETLQEVFKLVEF